jgi:2-iminobutanoate/2-iminopropanoate deaminase
MTVRKISTNQAPNPAGAYSQAIVAGDYIFVAGQGPINKDGEVSKGSIGEQTRLTLQNIEHILKEAGSSLADVVKISVHLNDLNKANFDEYNQVYEQFFSEPLPARITVGSQLLGIDIEIDVVAYIGE